MPKSENTTGKFRHVGESRTKKSFAKECDINVMMAKYQKSGVIPQGQRPLTYGDYTNVGDYLEEMNRQLAAKSAFESLPARIRSRMQNDVGVLIEFLSDPENLEEAIELGLVEDPKNPDAVPEVQIEPEATDAEHPES